MSQDQYYFIGEAAGKIFKFLESSGESTTAKLKTGSRISDSALFNQGLGWLAREGKIQFSQSGKTVKVALTPVV